MPIRLLFDENLPSALVSILHDDYPGSVHVRDVGLHSAPDVAIWQYAADRNLVIVTKDDDFRQRSFRYGAPPKVIWLRLGNCRRQDLVAALTNRRNEISQFVEDPFEALLVIVDVGRQSA